jgi:hypothetical protein
VRTAPCDLFSNMHHNSHSFILPFFSPSITTVITTFTLTTITQQCPPTITHSPMLDPPLENLHKGMAHSLLLCPPWTQNPDLLNNGKIGHYLLLVITDDMLATIIQVSPLVHDNLALTLGVGKGPTALHLNELSANGHSACNLVT